MTGIQPDCGEQQMSHQRDYRRQGASDRLSNLSLRDDLQNDLCHRALRKHTQHLPAAAHVSQELALNEAAGYVFKKRVCVRLSGPRFEHVTW